MPVSTYRVQLRGPADGHPGFTLDDAARAVPYLADLGATHLYCSPHLQSAPGSAHGYDIVDHSRVDDELGGQPAFDRLAQACRQAGLGIVLDVVPNHMAISEPESQNASWWSVLREGRSSPCAEWFDIDWSGAGKVLVPVLGGPLDQVAGELELLPDRIRYYEHEFPIAPGTLVDSDVLATLAAQHYRVCDWREARDALNYRRFFDITTLAGVRVELPSVFDATHALVLDQVRTGVVDGLRIDHPDGLADPEAYLARLAAATGGTWVVVEKILEPGERLPDAWATAGTTGYDALNDVLGVLVDPAGEEPLTELWEAVTGDGSSYEQVVARTKRLVLREVLVPEVDRLTELASQALESDAGPGRPETPLLRAALVELLACFGVYRAYLPPAGPADDVARGLVEQAVEAARSVAPHLDQALLALQRLVLAEGLPGPAAQEFVTRFQQTCGPAMAKGVEDTAFYRYLRLTALNEVGGDPGRFGLSTADFHESCLSRQQDWPLAMTTLSTHDTKRSEDVRARLVLLAQCPGRWREHVERWSDLAAEHRSPAGPDPATEQLIWQTLVGAWPLSADRAVAYVEKATREAKDRTSWVDPEPAFDAAVEGFLRAVLSDDRLLREIGGFVDELLAASRVTSLAQKAVQLTAPGVADTYQGTELWDLSLVDPDNRRPVDFAARQAVLRELDATPGPPAVDDSGAAKLHLVSTLLRLRRGRPELFLAESSYAPLDAGKRALAFVRSGQVVTVAPTRALLVEQGGWGDDAVDLPDGSWHDLLGARDVAGGRRIPLEELLQDFPVAVLVRSDVAGGGAR